MSALPAVAPEYGDDEPPATDLKLNLVSVLLRILGKVRERGPMFAAAVDAAVADVQKGN